MRPRQPDYVRGVLNLRGVIVPIIDLRCRFGQRGPVGRMQAGFVTAFKAEPEWQEF